MQNVKPITGLNIWRGYSIWKIHFDFRKKRKDSEFHNLVSGCFFSLYQWTSNKFNIDQSKPWPLLLCSTQHVTLLPVLTHHTGIDPRAVLRHRQGRHMHRALWIMRGPGGSEKVCWLSTWFYIFWCSKSWRAKKCHYLFWWYFLQNAEGPQNS